MSPTPIIKPRSPEPPARSNGPGDYDPLQGSYEFDSATAYRKRLCISLLWSIFVNILLVWLAFSVDFSRKALLEQSARVRKQPEIPRLNLVYKPLPPEPPKPPAPPKRTFLETDPSQASKEKPENAEFYSEHNTQAAQPKPTPVKSADIPLADGENTKTMATASALPVTRPPAPPPPEAATNPAKPAAPPSPPPQPVTKTVPPQPAAKEGDLAMLRLPTPPEKPPVKETKPAENRPSREPTPKSVPTPPQPANPSSRQVLASKSRLDGGVARTGKVLAFNSAESPFAAYDKRVIAKIGEYFMALNRERVYGGEVAGEVEIAFKLLPNGQVSDLRVVHNTANSFLSTLCMEVMERSAPFDPFPETMKAIVGEYREGEIRFVY